MPCRDRSTDRYAFGTYGQSEREILDIAPGEDLATLGPQRCPNSKIGIRCIRSFARRPSGHHQSSIDLISLADHVASHGSKFLSRRGLTFSHDAATDFSRCQNSVITYRKAVDDPRRTYSGKLIAVEGLDGSGKSTQIYLVKRWLELEGYRVFFTQWNSSVLVKNSTTKGKKRQLLTPTTFSLIHATDFADRYDRQIRPLLRAGYIVLADRYIYTALARDAVRGVDREWVAKLYDFAVHPDLTFYFKVPLEVSLARILEGRPALKYHEAGLDMGWSTDPYESFRIFQGKVFAEYEAMRSKFPFTVIDATEEIPMQQAKVRESIARSIDLRKYRRN
jgi:dTMP kinase